jgi:hypothetical protein
VDGLSTMRGLVAVGGLALWPGVRLPRVPGGRSRQLAAVFSSDDLRAPISPSPRRPGWRAGVASCPADTSGAVHVALAQRMTATRR